MKSEDPDEIATKCAISSGPSEIENIQNRRLFFFDRHELVNIVISLAAAYWKYLHVSSILV